MRHIHRNDPSESRHATKPYHKSRRLSLFLSQSRKNREFPSVPVSQPDGQRVTTCAVVEKTPKSIGLLPKPIQLRAYP
jgi:hypothetical protein